MIYFVLDVEGRIAQTCLKVQDVFPLPNGTRVLTEWNSENQPTGNSASLLAEYLGDIASKFHNFPIMYTNWKKVPEDYKKAIYSTNVKVLVNCN